MTFEKVPDTYLEYYKGDVRNYFSNPNIVLKQ